MWSTLSPGNSSPGQSAASPLPGRTPSTKDRLSPYPLVSTQESMVARFPTPGELWMASGLWTALPHPREALAS